MKKIVIAGIAALAIPAGTAFAQDSTPTPKEAAKAACKAQRDQMGKATFKATYGANAFGKCISAAAKLEKENTAEAKSTCKAEQADPNFAASHGGKTFEQFYGTNKSGKNAYGKCVSGKAKAASKEDVEDRVNAAKTCKQWRAANGADWAPYAGKKNGFGKCVSTQAKAQNDDKDQA